MQTSLIDFAGHEMQLHPDGALYWPSENLLVVSDLHFEKSSFFAGRTGQFLPPYDTQETLVKLQDLIEYFKPENLLFLGDNFHDAGGWQRMSLADKSFLTDIVSRHKTIWVQGNHDRGQIPAGFDLVEEVRIANIDFRHIYSGQGFEISGHYHPAIQLSHKGEKIRRPCFMVSQTHIILPAIGAYTGGLDVTHQSMRGIYAKTQSIYMTGARKILKIDI